MVPVAWRRKLSRRKRHCRHLVALIFSGNLGGSEERFTKVKTTVSRGWPAASAERSRFNGNNTGFLGVVVPLQVTGSLTIKL